MHARVVVGEWRLYVAFGQWFWCRHTTYAHDTNALHDFLLQKVLQTWPMLGHDLRAVLGLSLIHI